MHLDREQDWLSVSTKDGQSYVFDMRTGMPVSGVIFPFSRWILGVGILIVFVIAIITYVRSRRVKSAR